MLVDRAVIFIRGGKGGDGMFSLRREAYVPKGGPDGGDGGKGGHVILLATTGVDTLLDMAGKHHWYAPNGQPGKGKSMTGRDGEDLIIQVPPGTLVYDNETGLLLDDLDAPDKQMIAARGGRGGFGNEHFKSATNQVPRQTTPGEPGEEKTLRLELKLIADIGLIGKPNAGKSTLLSRLSKARPKIADYPFTTLQPQLGIAELIGYRRLVIADIPGLIEGAAGGAGLGHDFLRHIERTRILVHLLELEPSDGSDPFDNYRVIRRELDGYSHLLAEKPEIVAVNKADLLGGPEDAATAVSMLEAELKRPVIAISAATGVGCNDLLEACWTQLHPQDD
ncbi:GTPase ObgE [Planctomycetales bacterium ZRK34]|nr:GTPase ObgE [Planctomycetales bacterium ZRK34]